MDEKGGVSLLFLASHHVNDLAGWLANQRSELHKVILQNLLCSSEWERSHSFCSSRVPIRFGDILENTELFLLPTELPSTLFKHKWVQNPKVSVE